jgi:hypothetical protein
LSTGLSEAGSSHLVSMSFPYDLSVQETIKNLDIASGGYHTWILLGDMDYLVRKLQTYRGSRPFSLIDMTPKLADFFIPEKLWIFDAKIRREGRRLNIFAWFCKFFPRETNYAKTTRT